MIETNMTRCQSVTIGIIALNEGKYISKLIECLISQTFPKKKTEIIFVDALSKDNTVQIMENFKDNYKDKYKDIKIYSNAKKVQPAGWNIVIANASSDVVIRIDAHAELPANYTEACVDCLNSGEYVCGGPRENIIDQVTPWKCMLLDAERSVFGAGLATYRLETNERKYVDSVFHGAYRKEVFDEVGLFDERLFRTEDNEIHYRIRKAGYRICYDPNIRSYYQTRNSFRKMIKQKYGNGYWIGRTVHICPKCISLFHFAPLLLVGGYISGIILAMRRKPLLFILVLLIYCPFLLVNSVLSMKKSKNPMDAILPVVFLTMHIAYGFGTAIGLLTPEKRLH